MGLFWHFSTWSGPAWSPAQSLSSVLISIQSVMNEKPYHNEPGFEQVSPDYSHHRRVQTIHTTVNQALNRLVQTIHTTVNHVLNKLVQAIHTTVNQALNRLVQTMHITMNLALNRLVQTIHTTVNQVLNSKVSLLCNICTVCDEWKN